MNETGTSSSYGWLVILLIFIVVLGVMFGGVGFGGNRSTSNCDGTSNCAVEKQTIINTATTQNLINSQAEATRAQASRIFEAQQSEKLFDLKLGAQTTAILQGQALQGKDNEIALLKQTIDSNGKFYHLNGRLDSIECNMLPRPKLFGIAADCGGNTIPPLTA